MDGMMPPVSSDPVMPTNDARMRVAQAMMLQRGIGQQMPFLNYARMAQQPRTRTISQVTPTPTTNTISPGYPTDTIGGG